MRLCFKELSTVLIHGMVSLNVRSYNAAMMIKMEGVGWAKKIKKKKKTNQIGKITDWPVKQGETLPKQFSEL